MDLNKKRSIQVFTQAMEEAILRELSRPLAFGCVNLYGTGAHQDMTYQHFFASGKAIASSLEAIDWTQMTDLKSLRQAGVQVEKEMLQATGGINTHKGLVFLLLFPAQAWMAGVTWTKLADHIAGFAQGLKADYQTGTFRSIQLTAASGQDIRQVPLSGYRKYLDLVDGWAKHPEDPLAQDDLLLTLYLLAETEDTTTLHRSDPATLRMLQERARSILQMEEKLPADRLQAGKEQAGSRPDREQALGLGEKGLQAAQALSNYYDKKGISSGGVADLFVLSRLLQSLRKDFLCNVYGPKR